MKLVLLISMCVAAVCGSVIALTPSMLAAALGSPAEGARPSKGEGAPGTSRFLLVEFYAPWCGHCKELEPKYEYLGKKFTVAEHGVTIAKIDADAHGRSLDQYNVRGFPTIMFWDLADAAEPKKYEGAREPKQLVAWLNKQVGTALTADDWVRPAPPKRQLSPEMSLLYQGFDEMNKFQFTKARATLGQAAGEDSRSGKAASRVADKLKMVGKQVTGLKVQEWLQVDLETYSPPDLGEADTIFVVARLDFRSASRGSLEPLLEEILKIPSVKGIRITGETAEVEDDMEYAVAVAPLEGRGVLQGDDGLESVFSTIQDCVIIYQQKVVWNAHVGIMDEVLLASVKHLAEHKEVASLDQDCASESDTCDGDKAATHTEL